MAHFLKGTFLKASPEEYFQKQQMTSMELQEGL